MTIRDDVSLLLQLRNAAKVERDELIKFKMRRAADELDVALKTLAIAPNAKNLVVVNGLWSNGTRILGFATATDPQDGGAKMRLAA